MAGVIWQRLQIRGFGKYKEPVTVEFNQGLNVLIAPNETGKSTLIAGLMAVIFGLPKSSDPSKFGDDKFRNWEGADYFEGEVEFGVDGTDYRIKRLFNDNRIILSQKKDGQWHEEITGSHRPNARRPNQKYEERLEMLLGILSREVFEATFCLGQPLPDTDQLDVNVQTILSGSGGYYQTALKQLQEELKALTRYTRSLGVTDGEGRVDRELELIGQEIEDLRQGIIKSRETADNLQRLLLETGQIQDQLKGLERELQTKNQVYQAWNDWRILHTRYLETTNKQLDLNSARDKVRELQQSIEKQEEFLQRNYPEFCDTPEDLGDKLEDLTGLETELANRETKARELEDELLKLQSLITELECQLRGKLKKINENPDLLADFQELKNLSRDLNQAKQQLAETEEQQEKNSQELQRLPRWQLLDNYPTAVLRGLKPIQAELLKKWEQLLEYEQELQKVERKLNGKLSIFYQLTPEQQFLAKNYFSKKLQLETDYKEKLHQLETTRKQVNDYQDRAAEFAKEFNDLAELKDVTDLERKIELKHKLNKLSRELESLERQTEKSWKRSLKLISAGLLAVVFARTGWFWGGPHGAFLGALAGCAAGWLIGLVLFQDQHSIARLKKLQVDSLAVRKEMEGINARLGAFAGCDEVELGELRQKFKLHQIIANNLKLQSQDLPEADRLAELNEQVDQARQAVGDFHHLLKDLQSAFGGKIPEAYEQWKTLDSLRNSLEDDLQKIARQEFGVEPEEVEGLSVHSLKGSWRSFRILSEISNDRVETLADFVRWLQGFDQNRWDNTLKSAAAWENLNAQLASLEGKKAELYKTNAHGDSSLENLEMRIFHLKDKIAPFDAETELPYLKGQLQHLSQVKEKLNELNGTRQGVRTEKERLLSQLESLNEKLTRQRQDLEKYLAANQGNVRETRSRLQEYKKLKQNIEEAKHQFQGLLDGCGVTALRDLEYKITDVNNQAWSLLEQLENLIRMHPGLPTEAGPQREKIEAEYRSLETQVKKLTDEKQFLEVNLRELLRELARLEGQNPLNLAEAELELEELLKKKEKLELHTQAVALAYRELKGAVEEYNASYRERLAQTATAYFVRFTANPNRRIVISEEFTLQVLDEGRQCLVSQLSQGAQDQLYLALRLAIADLLAGDIGLPFIFDDPFHNFDSARLERIEQTLREIARKRQIFFLSHREDLACWGSPVTVKTKEAV